MHLRLTLIPVRTLKTVSSLLVLTPPLQSRPPLLLIALSTSRLAELGTG